MDHPAHCILFCLQLGKSPLLMRFSIVPNRLFIDTLLIRLKEG